MVGYAKYFNSKKAMSFKVNDEELLKKHTEILEKISRLMNKEFDSEPVYIDNNKFIKTKIKSYGDKVNTNSRSKKIPKENASYKCFSLMMLESVVRANKKYYPQRLLEECKYEIKKNKMMIINDDFDPSSSDEFENESDNEADND